MIDWDSPAGSSAKIIAFKDAMKKANDRIGGKNDERKTDTDKLRKEHPLHIR